jgi:LysR family transcriptional regulator, hydrogen peroxide-inducible genes activator
LVDIVPFNDPKPMRSVAVAWRASFPRPQAIDVLVDAIAKCRALDS